MKHKRSNKHNYPYTKQHTPPPRPNVGTACAHAEIPWPAGPPLRSNAGTTPDNYYPYTKQHTPPPGPLIKDFVDDSSSTGSSSRQAEGPAGLYEENGFRVLGMPVDASDMELQERHGILKTYASLGRIGEVYTTAFACEPPPSVGRLDRALERLNNGEQRAYDEFFWFWPREIGDENDPGLTAIAEGSANEARQHWREWEQEPGQGRAVARHNLAVNYLLEAIEDTNKHLAGRFGEIEAHLYNAWKFADKLWADVAGDALIWEETKKRILSKDDRALTAALADEMRAGLRKTFAAIHGYFARDYAEKGRLDCASFHVDAMYGGSGRKAFDDDYRTNVREITKPTRDRLEAARGRAQSYADSSELDKKKQAFAKARDFFGNDFEKTAKPTLDLFYAGDSDLEREKRNIYDKVAATIRDCCVAAFNTKQKAGERTDDDTALLKKALAIATDPSIRSKIEESITVPIDPALTEVTEMFVEVAKGEGSPSERFRKLEAVRPKLKTWLLANPRHQERDKLLTAFAALERSLSVDIFNQEDNVDLAITAIKCAIEDTPDEDNRKRFREDLATLEARRLDAELKALTEIFKQIAESEKSASERWHQLIKVRERFRIWAELHSDHEMCEPLMKALAGLERGLSVAMFNEAAEILTSRRFRDIGLELMQEAIMAIRLAIVDTPDDDDRRKYMQDHELIVANAKGLGADIPAFPLPVGTKGSQSSGGSVHADDTKKPKSVVISALAWGARVIHFVIFWLFIPMCFAIFSNKLFGIDGVWGWLAGYVASFLLNWIYLKIKGD